MRVNTNTNNQHQWEWIFLSESNAFDFAIDCLIDLNEKNLKLNYLNMEAMEFCLKREFWVVAVSQAESWEHENVPGYRKSINAMDALID